ncbi:Endo-1,4-beta-xylanase A precursor [Polaromonas sp. CG9_12]|nr:Endo-1,4-beta-xylanase A precursor [Polaromonas sp. CG9_12]
MARAQDGLGLNDAALGSGRRFGFAIDPGYANKEPVKSLLRQHAGVITAENAMKWRNIENVAGVSDYTRADWVADTAERLGAALRGHTLAWHQSTPAYLSTATREVFAVAQTAHLQAMTARYRGRIHTWDVLNEVIDGDQKNKSGLRESVLSELWGEDRYPELFELARASDTRAKLAYNDYGMEQNEPWCERRRTAVLRMLEQWIKRKTPVDVMGLQAHLDVSRKFSATRLSRFFDELRALGLGIQITELDVRDALQPGTVSDRDAATAALYKDFMDTCMGHAAVEMIVMWNVTDEESWVNRGVQAPRRPDGQPMRPTLFDMQGQPKAAFAAVAGSLRQAAVPFDLKNTNTKHV